ncbi:MAG: cytochrome c biogenesis protein CcsA [Cyclobacteriaceae bacterium]|nr:cytochrome c biogenesis protein CcsA [Cyclobacteriaceae bacterium HetDA_MAG_MS6]
MHYFIGNLGHIFMILAFVSSLIASIGFFLESRSPKDKWNRFNTIQFYIHSVSILGVLVALFVIINKHYFEYHYAWNYSSKYLPIYYQISSFWNGQEGSFLLWMFWNVILGLVLLHTNKSWKAPVMTVMSVTQLFLTSMVLGIVLFDVKIGSSPFLLLRDVISDAIFKVNPDFVPEDGRGLNPLLQNYWMVIHPPTLFLGFASTVVPFAFCISGVVTGKYKEWIRPALPWAQFSAAILGVGILMGAYWAYETLNFGGYWNWDPVENAIYVPWLTLVAGMHTMIAYKKSENALKASVILIVVTFILILYSTFLTRSGVLGETSVHSFTDLGLSGQLLIYLFVFTLVAFFFIAKSWKKMPSTEEEASMYSREFWIFMGATVLGLMAFHVIAITSFPVYNDVAGLFGFDLNLAPPTDPVESYSKVQIWLAIALAGLSGTGQFFWWKKMDGKQLWKEMQGPVIISMILAIVVFLVTGVDKISYLMLLSFSIYSIVSNAKILWSLRKSSLKLTGGSITHIGVAMMLIGILFSSGYSKIISQNYTGRIWNKELPEDINLNNLLIFLNEPRQMGPYTLTYKGILKKTADGEFLNALDVIPTQHPLKYQVIGTMDTVLIENPENSYFEVLYQKNNGDEFTLYPRIQKNEQFGMMSSPGITRTLKADLYTHITLAPDNLEEREWSETKEVSVPMGETFFVNDYVARFVKMERLTDAAEFDLGPEDVAVKAIIEVEGETKTYIAEPIYLIRNRMAGKIPFLINDLASQLTIQSINPEKNSFTFGIQTTQKDWIILEAVEKPLINLLWTGTLLLVIGFAVAVYRRYDEFAKMRDKKME